MGLDITAFRNLKEVPADTRSYLDTLGLDPPADVGTYFCGGTAICFGPFMAWSEGRWPGRAAPLNPAAVYTFTEAFGFRAGSYSVYDAWRDWLETIGQAIGLTPDDRWPFEELVNFADNRGVIGSIVAAKLANDFATYRAEAEKSPNVNEFSLQKYDDWRRAFEIAADGGAVYFH